MDAEREPLARCDGNVGIQKPAVSSKLPAPGSRLRLPTFGSKLRPPTSSMPVPSSKRRLSPAAENVEKKPKLDGSLNSAGPAAPKGRFPAPKSTVRPPTAARGVLPKPAVGSRVSSRNPAPTNNPVMKKAISTGSINKKGLNTSTTSKTGSTTGGAPKRPGATAGTGGTKRAAWDLKGRLQDMEQMMSKHLIQNDTLTQHISSNNDRIAHLEALNAQLKGTVTVKEKETSQASQQISDLERKLRASEEELQTMTRKMKHEIEDLQFSKSTLERQRETLEGELSACRREVSGLKETVASLTSSQAGIKAELDTTKLNLRAALEAGRLKDTQIADLKETCANQESEIREHEMTRRVLHNTIQELKGNIRVFCRVRPLLGEELLGNDGTINHIAFPDPDNKILELEKLADIGPNETLAAARKGNSNKYEFTFDRVFSPESSQAEVFEEISQLAQSALDGYNVCIFAYGQTGSGKTYTMEGPSDKTKIEEQGMIPRAVEQIFSSAQNLIDRGWEYEFEASFLEIYNETIRDLLGNGKDDVKHEIKMVAAQSTEVMVSNLTLLPVREPCQVHNLLSKAMENRAVAETKCNERSSRSHSVFRLKISGHNKITENSCEGILNLIDLAGSERLKDSGSQGARLKETQSINKSLANLGNVIMALANKEQHIPYRNSKLTHLLQNSLGGNSKTLMFVNVSPKEECFSETLNSLRFATKVNNCDIGTAQKRTK